MPELENGAAGGNGATGAATETVNNNGTNDSSKENSSSNNTVEETKTYSQSELDKAIAKAIQTRESNLKAEFDRKELERKGEYQKLYEQAELKAKQLEETVTRTSFISKNPDLAQFLPLLESTPIDKLEDTAKTIKDAISKQVEEQVRLKLNVKTPANNTQSGTKQPHEMTTEEYKEYRKTIGL